MYRRIRTSLVRLSIWTILCVFALPALAQTSNGSVSAAGWTSANWTTLITAIGSIIVALIGALKGTAAQSKTDANEQRLNSVSNRLDLHGHQITTLAQNQNPPLTASQLQMPLIPRGEDHKQ